MDAENPSRFQKLLADERPWPLVYSEREVAHARGAPDPALAYCAAFCAKEATLKALRHPFPLPQCEILFDPSAPLQAAHLAVELARNGGVTGSEVRFLGGHEGEVVAAVFLAGEATAGRVDAVLERLALGEAERDRDGLAARCLTAEEANEVAPRRLQTLSGFLALKRALCRLFSRVLGCPSPRETDFVLTHRPDGAPSLVRAPAHPDGRIFVSISHTRACAYGLAIFQESLPQLETLPTCTSPP